MKGESSFLMPKEALAAAGLSEGMQVADLGAGAGFFTRAAARMVGEAGRVWAVDIQQDLVNRIKTLAAAEDLHNVEVLQGDLGKKDGTHLSGANFDLAIVSNVLFMLDNKQAAAQEVCRILQKGGRALVIDWSGSHGGLGPADKDVVSRDEAVDIFLKNGFNYVGDVPAGEYHWGFLVRKKSESAQ
jgi:FkbM family methyltransferase